MSDEDLTKELVATVTFAREELVPFVGKGLRFDATRAIIALRAAEKIIVHMSKKNQADDALSLEAMSFINQVIEKLVVMNASELPEHMRKETVVAVRSKEEE